MDPIPGIQTLHARESWQDPKYPVFGPPDLPFDNDTVVIHYTAADDLIDGDPGEHADDLPQYMRNMQYSYVVNRGYSLGYLFAVDWLGGVWQIRGWEYQSAANAGHNTHTWPILMLVDGNDEATPEAAASVRALVAEAERRAKQPQAIKGHGQLKIETGVGTATACPGTGLLRQIKAGVFVPKEPTPPAIDDGEEEIMIAYYVLPPSERPNDPHLVVINASVRYRTNSDVNGIGIPEIRFERATHGMQYETLLQTVRLA